VKASRRDLLAECNTENEALPVFFEGWCKRCVNPECTRSLYGQSRFDIRVNSWEDRLFKNPPRMDSKDPRFKEISGKRFLTVDMSAPPEVRSWVDPVAATEPAPRAPVVALAPEPVVVPELPKVNAPEPQPVVDSTTAVRPSTPFVGAVVRPEVLSMNAQSQGGMMLSGVKPQQAAPVKDPWAAPEPAENVIPVGGRVKLGGSGV